MSWVASLQLEQEIEEIREEFKHIPVPDDKHTRKGFEGIEKNENVLEDKVRHIKYFKSLSEQKSI